MTHKEWTEEMLRAVALERSHKRDEALRVLERLARKSRIADRKAVSSWHEYEVLGFWAALLEEAGRAREAVRVFRKQARIATLNLAHWGHAAAAATTYTALAEFKDGSRENAVAMGAEALRLRAQFPEADPFFSDLIEEMGEYLNARAAAQIRKSLRLPERTQKPAKRSRRRA